MKIFYFEDHKKHDLKFHPENSRRIEEIVDKIEVEKVNPKPNEKIYKKVHDEDYLERIKSICGETKEYKFLDPDTYITKHSYEVCLKCGGLCIKALEEKHSFVLTRPPGHHAGRDFFGGFCILNHAAAIAKHIGKNTLILDIDYHHGNGTQNILWNENEIFFISIHRFGVFPGTGMYSEKKENIFNIPVEFSNLNDKEYYLIFEKIVFDLMERINPKWIVVSCGFDTFYGDPIGDWRIEKALTKIFYNLREKRIIFILEGGYNPYNILEGIRRIKEGLEGKDVEIEGFIRESFEKYILKLRNYILS